MTKPLVLMDLVVAMCILAAIFFAIATLRENPGPRRGRLKCLATILIGSVCLLGAVDSIATEAVAPRLSLTGYIVALKSYGGKNPSCNIELTDTQGSHAAPKGDFSCGSLAVGQPVKATWLAFNARIVRLDILSGANAGSDVNGSGRFGQGLSIALGAFMIFIAIRVQRTNPNADPPQRTKDDPPLSGVDEDSLLKLNGKGF